MPISRPDNLARLAAEHQRILDEAMQRQERQRAETWASGGDTFIFNANATWTTSSYDLAMRPPISVDEYMNMVTDNAPATSNSKRETQYKDKVSHFINTGSAKNAKPYINGDRVFFCPDSYSAPIFTVNSTKVVGLNDHKYLFPMLRELAKREGLAFVAQNSVTIPDNGYPVLYWQWNNPPQIDDSDTVKKTHFKEKLEPVETCGNCDQELDECYCDDEDGYCGDCDESECICVEDDDLPF